MDQLIGAALATDSTVVTQPKTRTETLSLSGISYTRVTLEPGWRWSECIGPSLGLDRRPKRHRGYMVSGRLVVEIAGAPPREFVAGDVYEFPPGHDAWVVGDDSVVHLDISAIE
ncbi:MAG TPA: hypothetical protein VHV31_11620 [Nitrolancea sp.]|nr:hypothetical protein [Nitrolancea sp.]